VKKNWPVHQPEKRNGSQGADAHRQSGKKTDLLLVLGQKRLSPPNGVILHSILIYRPATICGIVG
jgi:hypothetical protein